jgi:hypothetical protein
MRRSPVVAPASPPGRRLRSPSWFQPRLVTGLLLVAVSVATGARIVATADRSVQVWALARDVSAGTVLRDGDVRAVRVRLFESGPGYVRAAGSPAGRSVARDLGESELLPVAALVPTPPGMIVNIPVQPQHAPAVARGQSVDVWAGHKGCQPARVLAGVAVQDVRSEAAGAVPSATGSLQVVVRIGAADAERVLAALAAETTVRIVVLDGPAPPARVTAAAPCAPSSPGAGR